ncbi:hypothetical protein UFOVP63_10 [uncultured Caudovirales phage]|uniref:Uncharacterized protein n=1 Tax=uncultured Caudovirales phage TaxID=2100421 RepID=A0A6J5KRM1_9CAUD|nr:hypothetical protein UFOVP63_10 [uncultured Caudovirales phage]
MDYTNPADYYYNKWRDSLDRISTMKDALWYEQACKLAEKLSEAADRIEALESALVEIIDIHPFKDPEGDASVKAIVDLVFHINIIARKALEGKDETIG